MRNRDTNKRARANVKQTKHHSHSLIRVKLSRETHWIMCNRKLTLRLLGSRQQGSERCVAVLAVKLSTVMLLMGADKEKMMLLLQRMNARLGVGKLIPAPCARRTDALRWSVHGCIWKCGQMIGAWLGGCDAIWRRSSAPITVGEHRVEERDDTDGPISGLGRRTVAGQC